MREYIMSKLENLEYVVLVDEFKAIETVENKIAWLEANREVLETFWGTNVDTLLKSWSKNL
jgi:hypothetical protein